MLSKMKNVIVVLVGLLMWSFNIASAFNPWEDIQAETQWDLGHSVAAGTAVALKSNDTYGVKAGQFVGSALAEVADYRFISIWAGGNFIKQPNGELKALDTGKLGLNLAYVFKGFKNQPPELIRNLVIGPSLTFPIFTTPHVAMWWIDANYQFGGGSK